jgi:hypothetical protein
LPSLFFLAAASGKTNSGHQHQNSAKQTPVWNWFIDLERRQFIQEYQDISPLIFVIIIFDALKKY